MAETKTPGSRFDNETNQDPSKQHYDREFNDIAKNYSDNADSSQEDANIERLRNDEDSEGSRSADPKKSVSDLERNPDGFYDREPFENKLKGFIKKTASNRRGLALLGGGTGLVALAFAGFLAFLPLKLEMLIKTATQSAAEIPEHAIEHRLEYLTKLYIAQKVVGAANNTADIDVGEGSIAAGLFNTWRAAKYEKKLGFTIESDRLRPGETSFNWRLMDLEGKPLRVDGKLVNGTSVRGPDGVTKVVSELNGRKEFRTFLRAETKKATKWHQFYKRYAMRKTLMRKYGVAHWAWLPAAATEKLDSYAERRRALFREFRKQMLDVTVGRVTKKTSMYFSCLTQGKEECKKLKNDVSSNETIRAQQDSEACAGDAACEDRVRQNNENLQAAADQTQSNIDATSDTSDIDIDPPDGDDSPKGLSKLVTKQMLAKVLGGIGILDTLMRIVNSIENKGLNQVQFDRASTAYIGYTAELLSINDQMKAGTSSESDLSTGGVGVSMEQVDVAMTMLGDFGSSPVWQKEVGILSSSDISKSSFERECGPEKQSTTLPKGDTLCPERKVILEKNPFEGQSWWEATANFAAAYMKSLGGLIGLANKALGGIAEGLGFNALMEKILSSTGADKLIAKGMGTMLEMVFGAAINGQETDADAGDNVLGGIQSQYFALGQTGQDMGELGDGGGLGIGGAVTDETATVALKREIAAEKADEIGQKPLFARLFDTNDTDSLISQMAIRTPTSMSDLAAIPKMLSSSLAQIASPQLSAALPDKNAFGFNFSYSFSDAELEADPKLYTDESCEQSNDAREASYDNNDKYPILVYTKTDPCALEKVVADAGSSGLNNEPPRYFDIASMGSAGASSGAGGSFRIATFNVLGANHDNDCPDGTKSGCTAPVEEQWPARLRRSTDVMINNKLDIVGLQEFDKLQYDAFITPQYGGNVYDVYPKKSGNGQAASRNSIIWDKSKFKLVSGDIMQIKYFTRHLEDMVPVVKLASLETGQQFYVLNTHDPAGADYAKERYDDALLHEAKIKKLSAEGIPIFYTGDFNSGYSPRSSGNTTWGGPEGGIASVNERENLTYCILTRAHTVWDAFDAIEKRTGTCPTKMDQGGGPVDHIFFNTTVSAKNYDSVESGRLKNGSDVHKTIWVDITIPGSGGDNPGSIGPGGWQWPITKSDFTSLTGCYPTQNGTSGGSGHAGIDIDVPNVGYHQPSSPVYSATGGVVTVVSDNIGGGISGVQIKAGKGLYAVYEHMTGYRSLVHVGQTVKAGAKIGYASDVGATGAHHLHFGITTQEGSFGSRYNPTSGTLNPLDYLPKDRSLKNALGGQCVDSKGLAT